MLGGDWRQDKERASGRQQLATGQCVILDVGGDRFTASRALLERHPTTRLGKLMAASRVEDILQHCDEFFPGQPPEYYFDRNPDNFPAILDMFRSGMFHMSDGGCAMALQKDLEYWGLDELGMEPCCALKYYPQIDVCQTEKDGDIAAKKKELELATEEDFGNSRIGQARSWLWNTLEYPVTSKFAQIVAFFSLSMVLLSTITFVLATMEELQEDENGVTEFPVIVLIIQLLDNFVIIFFTLEYFLRLVVCPNKTKFIKDAMNMIDLLAISPFYINLLLEGLEDFEIIGKAGKIVRLVRVMRILRVFKLVRHFAGLQSLIHTLQQAYKELGLLLVLVAVAILTYSSLVYFAEKDPDTTGLDCNSTRISGVPVELDPCYSWTFVESFWWGLMTLTTVGYDLNPKTMLGKLVGGFCALSGVFILTLPIPIVVNSFAMYYKNRLWRTEVAHKKRERTRQQATELKEMQKFLLIKAMAAPGMTIIGGQARQEATLSGMEKNVE